jgi:hypothetical protein
VEFEFLQQFFLYARTDCRRRTKCRWERRRRRGSNVAQPSRLRVRGRPAPRSCGLCSRHRDDAGTRRRRRGRLRYIASRFVSGRLEESL